MYREEEGNPENDKTAIKWYTLAAKQGNWVAQSSLAEMYEAGEGVLKDDVKAYMWYNLAASSGRGMTRYSKGLLAEKMT